MWSKGTVLLAAALTLAVTTPGVSAAAAARPKIEIASTCPDMITGDTVLVRVTGGGGSADQTAFQIDGHRARAVSTAREDQWLVTGLTTGRHRITAVSGGRRATVGVRVLPLTGPVFSGPHLPLLACSTQRLGLGPAADADCSAPTKTTWDYKSTDGSFRAYDPGADGTPADVATTTVNGKPVPYIVRTEEGVINRSVYWISILDPEVAAEAPGTFTPKGWNERLVYRYGGGCGTSYGQGSTLGVSTVSDALLSKGYAVATATFNTFQTQCNDVLSAETTMMVKQRFAQAYGPPRFTIGDGGSGGAIQQLLIAQNYPGLLDAIAPTIPFPDAISIAPGVSDCGLLAHFFASPSGRALTASQRAAISGYDTWASCQLWIASFLGGITPSDGCDPSIAKDRIYDPATNPKGLRCTLADANRNQVGIDARTGFARRPLDNVGVPYGLAALNAGTINPDQFLDLNEQIGGYDIDGKPTPAREVASRADLRRAYATGFVFESGGGVRKIPVITTNLYTDPAGDIHTRFRVFTIRERLRGRDGTVDPNHTIWTRASSGSLVAGLTGAVADSGGLTTVLDEWLTSGTKPHAADDNCTDARGTLVYGATVDEPGGTCNQLYPPFGDPRTAAGASVRNDVLKCRLKPVVARDYKASLSDPQMARLRKIFPQGVCDWSKPGVGQVPIAGTWFDYSRPAAPVPRGSG